MSAVVEQLVTVEEFYEKAAEGFRGELVRGELKETVPTSILHGIIAGRIAIILGMFVIQNRLGEVLTAETGFRLFVNERTVRVPDVAFLSNEKLAAIEDFSKFSTARRIWRSKLSRRRNLMTKFGENWKIISRRA